MPSTRLCQLAVGSFFALSSSVLQAQEVIELPAEDRILEAEFEEVYRVGSLDGDAWEQFSRVFAVGFGQSGDLYVMDDQGGRIVVVSGEGEFVRQFGRIGDGPGEFAANTNTGVGFTVLRDGRTVVFDPGHSAFDLFGPDGEFERSVRMPGNSLYTIRTLLPARDGQNVITPRVSAFGRGGPAEGPEPPFRPVYRLVLTGDEAVQDTVIRAWRPSGDPDGFRPELVAWSTPTLPPMRSKWLRETGTLPECSPGRFDLNLSPAASGIGRSNASWRKTRSAPPDRMPGSPPRWLT